MCMYAFLHELCVFYIYVLSGEARIVSREDYGKILTHMASRELKEPYRCDFVDTVDGSVPSQGRKINL